MISDSEKHPRFVVVGCGESGVNTAFNIHREGVREAQVIAIHADKQHLALINADTRILIGKSLFEGIGNRANYESGKLAAEKARPTLETLFQPEDLVFVITGLDDGIGTGSPSIIAQVARERGATVITILSLIFDLNYPTKEQWQGISHIADISDCFIVLDRRQLRKDIPHLKGNHEYHIIDQILKLAIKTMIDTITLPSLINVAYADFLSMVEITGFNRILMFEESTQTDPKDLVQHFFTKEPRQNRGENVSATLLYIIGGLDLTLSYCQEIISSYIGTLKPHTPVISGACIRQEMEGKICILAITKFSYHHTMRDEIHELLSGASD
ncbi:MAG TPA: cell division protein FtsZ [Methanospirillum sp.]|nr:cell division protein FtsZ [Methanospirillum sp.]